MKYFNPIKKHKFAAKTLATMAVASVAVGSASALVTFDLRATAVGGVPSADFKQATAGVGQTITFELWVTVTGAAAGLEGFTNAYGSLLSTGGFGNFTGFERDSDFSGTASQVGVVQDLNGDGFMDIGSNAVKTTADANPLLSGTNQIFVRSTSGAANTTGDAQVTDGQSWRLGIAQFTVTGGSAGSVNFRLPSFTLPAQVEALWQEDGSARNSNGAGGGVFPTVSAPVLVVVPEPSAFGMVLLGAMGLVGFRRMGVRRA